MCGPCCPGKKPSKRLVVSGQEVGISGYDEIIAKGMEHLKDSDEVQRSELLKELRAHNYIPDSAEKDYLNAIWAEFKKVRAHKLGQLEEQYHGIPREEISWNPIVNLEKCTGCGACVKFCQKGVYTLDDKARVTNPFRCVVSCTGCLKTCPEEAISFPSLLSLREEMKSLRKKYGILSA